MHKTIACLLLVLFAGTAAHAVDSIAWQPWSEAAFAQAKREHKFVLLDLQAVWCHWCHVMDLETYSDPKIIALIKAHYIAVRVDQDSRPDLSNRYEDYGWPATVVFAADHSEIVKRQGYLPPREMSSMLEAIIADPSPGPSVTNQPGSKSAIPADSQELKRTLFADYDKNLGGWGTGHKYLDWDNMEYLLAQSLDGDAQAAAMAKQTLAGAAKLIDPVWGGADQYSISDWVHPHFEKLLQMQAEDMRIFALASATFHDPTYLASAKKIHSYVDAFLRSSDGVVYTSQDADIVDGQAPEPYYRLDEAARRKQGIPRIDTHVYARENGWWIEALCQLFAVTGDVNYQNEAVRAAKWIVARRGTADGGFCHGENAGGPLYLGDSLFMGRAFLALAQVTTDPAWLNKSERAATFIRAHFGNPGAAGFITATSGAATFPASPEFDENVALARWANLLAQDSGQSNDQAMAASALKYIRMSASSRFAYVGGYLMAQSEAQLDPLHVVVIGLKSDAVAHELFLDAISEPMFYKQIDWLDPNDPAQSAKLAMYPGLDKSAAFFCANQTCSSPVFTGDALKKLLRRTRGPK